MNKSTEQAELLLAAKASVETINRSAVFATILNSREVLQLLLAAKGSVHTKHKVSACCSWAK